MNLRLNMTIRSSRSTEDLIESLQKNKKFVDELIKKSFWLKLVLYHFRIQANKRRASISKHPLWSRAVLKIIEDANGSLIQVKIEPDVILTYSFMVLATFYFTMMFFTLKDFFLLPFCVLFMSAMCVTLYEEYKIFHIMVLLANKIAEENNGENRNSGAVEKAP